MFLDCGMPPLVSFAYRGTVTSTVLESIVTFECYQDYILEGLPTIECTLDGWTAPPVCRAGTAEFSFKQGFILYGKKTHDVDIASISWRLSSPTLFD